MTENNYRLVWHCTSKANHTKIIRSGKFNAGTYFAADEETAKGYKWKHARPVVMCVAVANDALHFDGTYYSTWQPIQYNGGIYKQQNTNSK